jgi:probable rRNA maturation factor
MTLNKVAPADSLLPDHAAPAVFLDFQCATDFTPTPTESEIEYYLQTALRGFIFQEALCVTIRLVDKAEMQALNLAFRGKDKPTNVLSFPFEMPQEIDLPERMLGDILICPAVLMEEAIDQKKSYDHHVAHMVIHGVLHLLGYDHMNDSEAEIMESLEIERLKQLNIQNPYLD